MGTGYGEPLYHGERRTYGRLASKPGKRKLRDRLRIARCCQYKKSPTPIGDFLYYPPLKLWRKPDKAYQRCKVTSNHRMLICIACRNGDVPAKICVKSLEKEGVSVLHENLRLKRKERGLSQEELASRLHVVRQTISKWEKECLFLILNS